MSFSISNRLCKDVPRKEIASAEIRVNIYNTIHICLYRFMLNCITNDTIDRTVSYDIRK